ncbi:MAG: hypothetical protein WBK28_02740 [Minisyncoccia bacterium]
MNELLTIPQPPPAPSSRTTLGSLVIAMCIGAFLAVSGLYFWGAHIEKEETQASVEAGS